MTYVLLAIAGSAIQLAVGVAFGIWLRRDRGARAMEASALALAPAPAALDASQLPSPPCDDLLQADWRQALEQFRDTLQNRVARLAEATGEISALETLAASQVVDGLAAGMPGLQGFAKPLSVPQAREAADAPASGVVPEPEVRGSDRRAATRRHFAQKQFVAPYHGGCLPGRVSFREVTCQDISATGFSFLSPQLPDFESLVVALGVSPNMTYMTARVVNRIQIADDPAPLYRIGCRFSGRIA